MAERVYRRHRLRKNERHLGGSMFSEGADDSRHSAVQDQPQDDEYQDRDHRDHRIDRGFAA